MRLAIIYVRFAVIVKIRRRDVSRKNKISSVLLDIIQSMLARRNKTLRQDGSFTLFRTQRVIVLRLSCAALKATHSLRVTRIIQLPLNVWVETGNPSERSLEHKTYGLVSACVPVKISNILSRGMKEEGIRNKYCV